MNFVMIIEGVGGALVVIGAVVTTLLCARRKKQRSERIELDPILEPVIRGSISESEGSVSSLSHDAHSTQSTNVIADPLPSASTSSLHPAPWHHYTSPDPDTSTPVTTKLSVMNPSDSDFKKGAATRPRILVPSQPSPSVASESSCITPMHPKHELMYLVANPQANTSNAQLTGDVNGSRHAYVPATDPGLAMGRTRTWRASRSQGLWGDEMKGDVRPGTAPPSYDVLYDRWA